MNDQLEHSGVLGMHWGIHRHRAVDVTKGPKQKPPQTEEEKKQSIDKKKSEIIKSRSAKQLYENKELFNYQELTDAYKMLVIEKNIKNLVPEHKNSVEKVINKVTHAGTKVADLMVTVNRVYGESQKIRGYMTGSKAAKDAADKSSQADNILRKVQKKAEKKADKVNKNNSQKKGKEDIYNTALRRYVDPHISSTDHYVHNYDLNKILRLEDKNGG